MVRKSSQHHKVDFQYRKRLRRNTHRQRNGNLGRRKKQTRRDTARLQVVITGRGIPERSEEEKEISASPSWLKTSTGIQKTKIRNSVQSRNTPAYPKDAAIVKTWSEKLVPTQEKGERKKETTTEVSGN